MRKILLATVAAVPLLAVGMMPASSQDIKQPGKGGVSQSQGQAGAKQQRSAPQGREAQGKPEPATQGKAEPTSKLNQTSDSQEKAQARPEAKPQRRVEGQPGKAGSERQADQVKAKQGQAEERSGGQASKGKAQQEGQDKGKQSAGKQPVQKEPARTSGQAKRPDQETGTQENKPQQNNAQQNNNRGQQDGQAENRGREAGGRVTLNEEQRTKIRQTVLAGRNVPRVDRVNFTVDVGIEVPREVRIVEVPPTLIEINPQWRGYQYFVVEDDIVIVDRSRKIVARLPVGSSSASTVETRTTTIVELEPAEIRRVQEVLIEKGFFHGRVDGLFSPEFKEALIKFQEREGIEASGRIDERTSAALGVSVRTQGQANENERNERGRVGERPGRPEPTGPTSGQAGGPRDRQNDKGGENNRPSTSGQGGNAPSVNEHKTSGPQGGTVGQSTRQRNQPTGSSEDQRKR
jgi:hypothetical protein